MLVKKEKALFVSINSCQKGVDVTTSATASGTATYKAGRARSLANPALSRKARKALQQHRDLSLKRETQKPVGPRGGSQERTGERVQTELGEGGPPMRSG